MSLIEAIENATPLDLIEIEEEITALESRIGTLREMAEFLRNRLHPKQKPGESVRAFEYKAQATNGQPNKEPAAERRDDTQGIESVASMLDRIYDVVQVYGRVKASVIAEHTGIDAQRVGFLTRHPWFDKTYQGIAIAKAGEVE